MASINQPGANLYVFREARRAVPASGLCRDLAAELDRLEAAESPARARRIAEDALLRAGEIECLLTDHGSPRAAEAAAVADRLAAITLGASLPAPRAPADLGADLPPLVLPSPPEGFAYYALLPRAFADLARAIAVPSGAAAVIGIRTIGATLSAVVSASLRLAGIAAERITARPKGHPYARELPPDPALTAWMARQRDRDARFFVVDEGPGMSGSSFLAVGEAIAREGVDPKRIVLLGSRPVDPRDLLADRAAERYAAFAGLWTAPPGAPLEEGVIDVSAGLWRARFWPDEARWPATWTTHERVKRISGDGQRLYKFEGLGRWGAAARERARAVAEAGFGPAPIEAGSGFTCYPMIAGRPLSVADRSWAVIQRLADYCAFRAAAFPVAEADSLELQAMVHENAGVELGRPIHLALPLERPVIADARLHPHEWIATDDGRLLKVDAATHGDDHIFPGPTDIAWDLASAIVEWDLTGGARQAFLDRYARASGDRPEARLPAYLTAYLVQHLARARMAAGALAGTPEEARLLRDHARYRSALPSELLRDQVSAGAPDSRS
ncbi:MAG: hypothetical protein QM820_43000 [Minicystis sp.]